MINLSDATGIKTLATMSAARRGVDENADLRARLAATQAVLAERERELLTLKGPCGTCPLHYAHAGPCAPARRIHGCPQDDSGLTPCCQHTLLELPRTDRVSVTGTDITCTGADAAERVSGVEVRYCDHSGWNPDARRCGLCGWTTAPYSSGVPDAG